MDDLATSLGMSKKTIYELYPTKTALVRAVMQGLFNTIETGVFAIRDGEQNAVEKMLEIRHLLNRVLRNERSAPEHQLMKYYPAIHRELSGQVFTHMQDTIMANLKQGKDEGLYREELDQEVAMRFYYQGCINLKDQDIFPPQRFPIKFVQDQYIEFYLRAIVTPAGLDVLTHSLNQGR